MLQHVCPLARKIRCAITPLLHMCVLPPSPSLLLLPGPQGKSIPVLCLEGLSELVQIVVTRYHSEQSHNLTSHETAAVSATQTFLTAINPSVDNPAVDMGTALEEKIHFFIRQLQVCVCVCVRCD